MYLFFLICFFSTSIILIFLILLQPGKGLNHTPRSSMQNSVKLLHTFGRSSFITKIIGILACFFLFVNIILCNFNNQLVAPDYFWEKNKKNITVNKNLDLMKKKELNTDIPN